MATLKSKKPLTKNSGRWTDGRYRAFITATLRGGMRRWPPKWEALRDAYTRTKVNKKSGRKAAHYRCARCEGQFPRLQVQVDHIKPVVDPHKGWESWDTFIERLFCEKENLQILCKECHKKKGKEDKNV